MMIAETLATLLRVNLAIACAVLLVLALRGAMRAQFGARAAYALWLIVPVVALAALLPPRTIEVLAEASVSLDASPRIASGASTESSLRASTSMETATLLLGSWLVGIAAMLIVLTMRQRGFISSLGRLIRDANGTLRAEANCSAPLLLGAWRPELVLPLDFETQFEPSERHLMLAHERVHLERGDARINGFASLMQCICWFNPLVHVAASSMRVDQELACDATVVEWYPRERRIYAATMLKAQLASLTLPLGCAWSARGDHPLKLRIAMLRRATPSMQRVAAGWGTAVVLCLLGGCVSWANQPPREVTSVADSAASARLLRAVLTGDAERAAAAIGAGADVNVRTRRGMTALTIAARAEDMRILELLLAHGADVHLRSRGEGNALVAAGRRGHVYAVKALVEHGATINEIVPEYGTPLAASVRTGQFAVVKYLVEHGADVNQRSPPPAPWDRWGGMRTPLAFAVDGGHASTAEYLRSMGAAM